MTVTKVLLHRGRYADSVALMQLSQAAARGDGVLAAQAAMASPLNVELLVGAGFRLPDGWGPNDLVVAVRARDEASLDAALAGIEQALVERPRVGAAGGTEEQPPRTVSAAARRTGPALALISVPGAHAFTEAMDALDAGCDVLIFSDNVTVEHEVRLKQVAAERGRLVMGPDCGTAVVAGAGLGFSHSLDPGPVGLVAASGTGAQQVLCLLDAAGVGVSAALGVGGRDLSAAVGGLSTRAALTLLDADPATDLIVVVSKPPDPTVAAEIRALAHTLDSSVQFALLGAGEPDLTAAVEAVLGQLGRSVPSWPSWPGPSEPAAGPYLRGLFAGGTLCDEAMVIASAALGEIGSNIPLRGDWRIDPSVPPPGHAMIDFGDVALTVGRPHPMIDQSLRLARLHLEADDPNAGVLLLDVVLGHGAHPDPAAELAPAIAAARSRRPVPVVVTLVGAKRDPQDLLGQARALQAAGAHVFTSNAQAALHACTLIGGAR